MPARAASRTPRRLSSSSPGSISLAPPWTMRAQRPSCWYVISFRRDEGSAAGGADVGGLELVDLLPGPLDVGGGDDDEVAGPRHSEGRRRRRPPARDEVEMLLGAAALERAFLEQVHHLAARAAPRIGILAEDELVEDAGGDSPELDDVLVAPVAGHRDRTDRPLVAVAESAHDLAERMEARGIMGIVDDDPEAVGVVDVEAARILLEGRAEL